MRAQFFPLTTREICRFFAPMSDLVLTPRRVLEAFLLRVEALSVRSGLSLATLSTRLFNNGSKIKDLKAGKDVGVRRLDKAVPALMALEAEFPPVASEAQASADAGHEVAAEGP